MSEHSPRPWVARRNQCPSSSILDANGKEVAVVHEREEDVDGANALHIVRCVNSHDGMVNILKLFAKGYDECSSDVLDLKDFCFVAVEQLIPSIRAALREAGAE